MSLPQPSSDPRSDEDLIVIFAAGRSTPAGTAAFDILFLRYEVRVKDFHSIRWPKEAEDMTQETFIRLVRFANKYERERGSFKKWIYSVAANAQKDYCRRHLLKWTKICLIDDLLAKNPELSPTFEPIQPGCTPEYIIYTRELIKQLPIQDREIVFLYYVERYTDSEIADILRAGRLISRLTAKGVATRRRRALLQLHIDGDRE